MRWLLAEWPDFAILNFVVLCILSNVVEVNVVVSELFCGVLKKTQFQFPSIKSANMGFYLVEFQANSAFYSFVFVGNFCLQLHSLLVCKIINCKIFIKDQLDNVICGIVYQGHYAWC